MMHELTIERTLDAPRDAIWRAFTGHLAEWWCPRPWTTEVVEADWHAGGRFATIMRGPDGAGEPGESIFLEVTPGTRIVFTNLLRAGWLPQDRGPFGFVGQFEFADADAGRRLYRASARHWSEDAMKAHADMGFEQGWGVVAGQLEAVARRIAGG